MSWTSAMQRRFEGRQSLSPQQLALEFRADGASEEANLRECLSVFHEFGLEPGRFRREDPMALITAPPKFGNAWSDFWSRWKTDEHVGELDRVLTLRRKQLRLPYDQPPRTIGALVEMWFGRR